jgi:hypothetical protein
MATSAPTALFERLVHLWRELALRSDVDDICLELIGRFSLEKVYVSAADADVYVQLLTTLLIKLEAILYVQRLTLPTDNVHASRYLGLLISWEVLARTVDVVLHALGEVRNMLAEETALRDRRLPRFLLLALRVLALHPRQPGGQRGIKEKRERFGRMHGALEHIADGIPGPRSFLLETCMEMAAQIHASDTSVVGLPPGLKYGLPNLAVDMVRCCRPINIAQLMNSLVECLE